MASNRATVTEDEDSSGSISGDEDDVRYFSLYIRGEGEVGCLIQIQFRQNLAYADIRHKLVEDGFNDILKEKGLDIKSLHFYPAADGPCQLDFKQEPDRKTWNVWEYVKGTGDGSFQNPYRVFMG